MQVDDLDHPRQRPHQRPQRVQLVVAEAARLLRGPARRMDRAVGELKRQRNIVGDAFGPHVVEERKAFALRIVEAIPDLLPLFVQDRERAVLNSGELRGSEFALPTTTSAPGRQMKLTPKISGCSVCTKTPTRQSGKPACTRRSQVSAIMWLGLTADLAPSISQSVIFCSSGAFMVGAFAERSNGNVKSGRPAVENRGFTISVTSKIERASRLGSQSGRMPFEAEEVAGRREDGNVKEGWNGFVDDRDGVAFGLHASVCAGAKMVTFAARAGPMRRCEF